VRTFRVGGEDEVEKRRENSHRQAYRCEQTIHFASGTLNYVYCFFESMSTSTSRTREGLDC
jgi:hypothetical protein